MAKYLQNSSDISIEEISGTENIQFNFANNNSLNQKIGDLTNLETTVTNNLVGAINSLVPTILYNNSTGSTSNITLIDNYTNYKFIEIWGISNNRYCFGKLDTSMSNSISFSAFRTTSETPVTLYTTNCSFSNNTITITGGSIAFSSSDIVGTSSTNEVSIIKVIGYK